MIHDRQHEEWLAELATGGAEPDSTETRARLENCPACADGWAELRQTQTALERALRDERDLVTALRKAPPAPGEDRALATLRAVLLQGAEAAPASATRVHSQASHPEAVHAPADDSPSGSSRRAHGALKPGARWALIAAGLVCAFAIGWSLRARSTGGVGSKDVVLGAGEIRLLAPVGEAAAFDVFRWEHTLAPGEIAHVVVSYRSAPGESMMSKDYRVYQGNEWRPTREVSDQWPAEIDWRVQIESATNDIVAESGEAHASRMR